MQKVAVAPDWDRLVAGGFAYMDAPFGSHPKDRERALAYLREAVAAGLAWEDISRQLVAYMRKKNMRPEAIEKNIDRAARLMKEWLE